MKRREIAGLAALALSSAASVADPSPQVQFFDASGTQLTNVTVDVTLYDAAGGVASRLSLMTAMAFSFAPLTSSRPRPSVPPMN